MTIVVSSPSLPAVRARAIEQGEATLGEEVEFARAATRQQASSPSMPRRSAMRLG